MMIRLYSWPMSSGTRIAWALEELALPYQYVLLDSKKQEHRAPELLAVNPHGKVPAFVDGELKLFESGAILLYLGNRYGAAKGLWPEPKAQQALADAVCWTVWAMTEVGGYMMQYVYHGLDSPVSYKPEDRSKAAATYNRAQLDRLLDSLEMRLDDRDYLKGGFSLVDIAVASWLLLGMQLGLPLEGYPRVAAWCQRCAERPAFKRAR
ncbi:MAG: glutathione S-transferase family protein [Burkholderiaceae bacterium]